MIFKKKEPIEPTEKVRGLLDVDGATCTSCVYTIEHVGAKLKGVYECYVDRSTSQIQLTYDGQDDTLNRIVELVDKIGYTAVVNTKNIDQPVV